MPLILILALSPCLQLLTSLLSDLPVSISSLSGSRAPHVYLLHNRQASNFGQPQGNHLCERAFTLLRCRNDLDIRCGNTEQTELSADKQAAIARAAPRLQPKETTTLVPDPQPSPPGEVPRGKPASLLPVPDDLCQDYRGGMVALVRCGGEQVDKTQGQYANNGYYKCRNMTHWLSGCRRFPA
jgi:hypothetical protein